MKKAVNRFWDWIFHPSVRPYTHPKQIALSFRYPSPGNVKLDCPEPSKQVDYKTPYKHSHYDVRYEQPTQMQTETIMQQVKAAPLCSNPMLRLKKAGFLREGEENNVDKVAAAKAKFKERYGSQVEETVYSNPSNYNLLKSTNREEVAAYVASFYQEVRHAKYNSLDSGQMRQKTIDDPEIVPLESVDLYTAPHFQQGRINNQYFLELEFEEATKKNTIDTYVGDARFWKAIDDAFESEEIEKVQKHVGDPEPLAFELRPGKIEIEIKEGEVVDLHPKN